MIHQVVWLICSSICALHSVCALASGSSCPTIVPSWKSTGYIDVCFSTEAAAAQFQSICSSGSLTTCLELPGHGVLRAEPSVDPKCVTHAFSNAQGSTSRLTARLTINGCKTVQAPVVVSSEPPQLQSHRLDSDVTSDKGHLALHFTQPIKTASRAQWSLSNARLYYLVSRNTSVYVGLQFQNLQKPAVLQIPSDAVQDAVSGATMGTSIVLELTPELPTALAASVNSAAALTALLGSAAPLRIARSILHSQFLSWTGALAVPAIPALYHSMARSLRWKQLVLEAIKMAFTSTGSESSKDDAPNACSFASVWITTCALATLCAVAMTHICMCAAVRTVCSKLGRSAPKFTTGVLAGGSKEAAVAIIILPGFVFSDASNLSCSWTPLAISLAACAALFLPAVHSELHTALRTLLATFNRTRHFFSGALIACMSCMHNRVTHCCFKRRTHLGSVAPAAHAYELTRNTLHRSSLRWLTTSPWTPKRWQQSVNVQMHEAHAMHRWSGVRPQQHRQMREYANDDGESIVETPRTITSSIGVAHCGLHGPDEAEQEPEAIPEEERTLSVIQRFLERQFETPVPTSHRNSRRITHASAANASESANSSLIMHAHTSPCMHSPACGHPTAASLPTSARTSRAEFTLGAEYEAPSATAAEFETEGLQPQAEASSGGGDGDPGLVPPSRGSTGIRTRPVLEPLHYGPLTGVATRVIRMSLFSRVSEFFSATPSDLLSACLPTSPLGRGGKLLEHSTDVSPEATASDAHAAAASGPRASLEQTNSFFGSCEMLPQGAVCESKEGRSVASQRTSSAQMMRTAYDTISHDSETSAAENPSRHHHHQRAALLRRFKHSGNTSTSTSKPETGSAYTNCPIVASAAASTASSVGGVGHHSSVRAAPRIVASRLEAAAAAGCHSATETCSFNPSHAALSRSACGSGGGAVASAAAPTHTHAHTRPRFVEPPGREHGIGTHLKGTCLNTSPASTSTCSRTRYVRLVRPQAVSEALTTTAAHLEGNEHGPQPEAEDPNTHSSDHMQASEAEVLLNPCSEQAETVAGLETTDSESPEAETITAEVSVTDLVSPLARRLKDCADLQPAHQAPASSHHDPFDFNHPSLHIQHPATPHFQETFERKAGSAFMEPDSFRFWVNELPEAHPSHPTLPPWAHERRLHVHISPGEAVAASDLQPGSNLNSNSSFAEQPTREYSFSASWNIGHASKCSQNRRLRNIHVDKIGSQPLFEALDAANNPKVWTTMESFRATFSATGFEAQGCSHTGIQELPETSRNMSRTDWADLPADTAMHVPVGPRSSRRASRSSHQASHDLASWNSEACNQEQVDRRHRKLAHSTGADITDQASDATTPVDTLDTSEVQRHRSPEGQQHYEAGTGMFQNVPEASELEIICTQGRTASSVANHKTSNTDTLRARGTHLTDTHISNYTTADGQPLWQTGKWMFGTSVVLGLVFGLFSDSHRSPLQVGLVLCIQMVHVIVLWGVIPLSHVGWQACIVDLEEVVLLCMAAALLLWGQASPTWLKDGLVWMFPVIIATMMIGDGLGGAQWLSVCK